MYIDKALERLNQIEWSEVGTKGDKLDGELFTEFLRRLAYYYQKMNMPHAYPPMWRFISLFHRGDFTEDMESYKHSTFSEIKAEFPLLFEKIPKNTHFVENWALCYIQMARDVDNGEADPDDLDVLEPIWIILQRGGMIYRGDRNVRNAVDVLNGGYFLYYVEQRWYDKALNYKPLDLSQYKTE